MCFWVAVPAAAGARSGELAAEYYVAADLIQQGRVKVLPGGPAGEQPSAQLLREVLHGLRAL